MKAWMRIRAAVPYLGAMAVVVLSAGLIATIYLTAIDLHWLGFLAGVLMAASIALASRASTSTWTIARRTSQLAAVRAKLAAETALRERAEQALAGMRPDDGGSADEHALYSSTLAGELTAWRDVAHRLRSALDADEFCLYAQGIEPARADARALPFLEVLLRLQEEEDNLMPPGAFLPLAEEHGLLPDIDRWVVGRLLDWAAEAPERAQAIYSVNVSAASIADPAFAGFVRDRLGALRGRAPGLCFEFNEAEAMANLDRTIECVRNLAADGCRFALSGFGRDPVSFALPRRIAFDYIKIDAGVILAAARGPVELAKVKAINRVAHSLGAKTIALCVESEATRTLLGGIDVDFVQGFAVSRPAPLARSFEVAAIAAT